MVLSKETVLLYNVTHYAKKARFVLYTKDIKAHIPVYHKKVPEVSNLNYVAKQWTKSMKELVIISDAKIALQGTEVSWGKPL